MRKPLQSIVYLAILGMIPCLGWSEESLCIEVYQISAEHVSKESLEKQTIQEILEVAGMKFPEGASAVLDIENYRLTLINTDEQLTLFEGWLSPGKAQQPKSLHVIAEWIEVEASMYHDWMFENRMVRDGTPLREEVQQWIREEKAAILETAVVQSRSGNESRSESYSFLIYPSEGDPPEIPQKVNLSGANTKAPIVGGMSAAFECRNVGTTFRTNPVIGSDGRTIDINLSADIVRKNGLTHWPPEEVDPIFVISMPKFYTIKAMTQVTARHGRYSLVSTMKPNQAMVEGRTSPLILFFVRGDIVKSSGKPRTEYDPNQKEGGQP